jgi:hypothetical protein
MRFTFTLYDVTEISSTACRAFISTFRYQSDLSDFDPDLFGCGEITPEVESMVENTWEICNPLENVYGETASEIIKKTVNTATEETQCAGLKFFNSIIPGEDRNLIETCTEVSFWCCCETIKRVSPIIAQATSNLMY